jgi:hypothetical protein
MVRPMNPQLRARRYLPAKGLLEPNLARVVYKTMMMQQWSVVLLRLIIF